MTSARGDPGDSAVEVVLRDGRIIRVRPMGPGDRQRVADLFGRLSPHSRYLRFHHARKGLTERKLAAMAAMHPPDRGAYVATLGEGEQERAVAMGEWQLLPDGTSAEIAFMVEDPVHARGIGTALLERLAETASRWGIKRFVASVLPENTKMLQVFEDSGLPVTQVLEAGVYAITLDLEEQGEFTRRHERREHIARAAGVRRLLAPRSVAVIGASREPRSVGGAVFRNLLSGGFTGTLHPVNPKASSVSGVLAYPSIAEVPGEVDLAVVVVPAARVLEVVDQCGRKGVWGLVIISAGFGEAGEEGRRRERLLKEKALGYGMRVIGPNCLGILNNDPAVRLNATFAPVMAPAGNVAVGAQSGAVGLAVLDHARSIGLGVSSFVSLGNRMDISSNDLLELWEDDESTDVIVLYLESFGNPRKFSRIARRVSRKKPIIAVKAGRSAAGAQAAMSHTGALAASDVAVDALFAQAGVIRVDTIEELFNTTLGLAHQPAPRGPRVGIVTNAGGLGVMAADACEGMGLAVPPLGPETQAQLRGILAPEAAVHNPVDAIAAATPEQFERALSLVLDEPALDAAIVLYIPPLVTRPEEIAASVRRARATHGEGKPLYACFMMAQGGVALRTESGQTVPCYAFPEDAAQALARSYQYALYRDREAGQPPRRPNAGPERARELVRSARAGRWLLPEEATALLREYGIPAAEVRVAASAEAAARHARELGFPVALKVRSATIVHKTDVGGVALGLGNEDELRRAYEEMERRLERAGRRAEMEGVVVQPMIRGGQEVIIGMTQDPVFGPLIMTGIGGLFVELLKDVAFALQPLTDRDPDRMLGQLKGLPLLQGWRGGAPKDVEALKDALLRFSVLVEDLDEIEQMEINPLVVLDRGQGCVAVDARVLVKASG